MRARGVAAVVVALVLGAPAVAGAAPPDIDVNVSGPRGEEGWYVGDVTVVWSVAPPDAADEDCELRTDITTDTPGRTVECHAANADGTASASVTVRRDATPPATTVAASRPPDENGWYRGPVALSWSGSDATSGVASCTRTTYTGPDTAAGTVAGTCQDRAGNTSAPHVFSIRYDVTAPTVTGVAPSRAAAPSGWFTTPVDLVWIGTDATSGIERCTALHVAAGGTAAGTCRDRAGNTAAPLATTVRYDATAPVLQRARATRLGRTRARVAWQAEGASLARVTRRPGRYGAKETVVYAGSGSGFTDRDVRRGRRYAYTIEVTDQAGNADRTTILVRRPDRLLAPDHDAQLTAPPLLRWHRVRGARFYNVQLFRGGRKILTMWPTSPRLQLPSAWRFGGQEHRLVPGTYRWYVWAAHGTRSAPRYGRVLGRRSFTIG